MSHYPTLYLLNVEQLPHNRTEIRQATTSNISRVLDTCISLSACASDAEALVYINDAYHMMPIEIKPATSTQHDRAIAQERPEEHDFFFNIVRIDGDPLHVLVHSILQASGELLEDVLVGGTTLDSCEWGRLRASFDAMLLYLSQERVHFNTSIYPPRNHACGEIDPLRRWRIGHHVFLTLIQNLVVALGCFGSAIAANDLPEAGVALELATILMWGSASALRFAGDFHPQQYETVVRPAMMPPNLEPGFSGLQSRDHYYLIKLLTRLKPVFMKLNSCLYSRHQQFLQAFEGAYDAHKFVCARFKGNQQSSLRMNLQSDHSAVSIIDQLKHARLRNLRPEA